MPESVPDEPLRFGLTADMALLDVVVDAQVRCVRGEGDNAVFGGILAAVLQLSGSMLVAVLEVPSREAGDEGPEMIVVASSRGPAEAGRIVPEAGDPAIAHLAARAAATGTPVVMDWPGGAPGQRFTGVPLEAPHGRIGVLALISGEGISTVPLELPEIRVITASCASLLAAHADRRMRAIANRRLRESEAKGQAILDNVSDAIIMIDEGGLIESANAATSSMFGYEPSELLGQNVAMLMPEHHRSRHDTYISEHLRTGRARIIGIGRQVEGVRRDGTHVPLDLTVNSVNLGERRVFVGVLRDASERQVLDQHVAFLQSDLSSRIDELHRVAQENALLGEFSSFLQAAANEDEARRVLRTYGSRLFPAEAGAFFRLVDDQTLIEASTWGPSFAAEAVLQRRDCWALRRSDVHLVEPGGADLVCAHLRLGPMDVSLCVPVMSPDGVVGLMTLQWTAAAEGREQHNGDVDRNRTVINVLADRLGSALSSISLRVRLEQESIRDPLTRTYNRRHLEPAFDRAIQQALQDETSVSVIMADIDHFKQVNDTYGHEVGDDVLRVVAESLGSDLRRGDAVCRIGGEEFLILLPGAPIEVAAARAERIRVDRSTAIVNSAVGPIGPVTLSLGVASYPTHGTGPEDVMAAADAAMYQAKATGRNRVVVASESHPRPVSLQGSPTGSRDDGRADEPARRRASTAMAGATADDATDAA
jgi:diguanylate cyclase (GGDEF)-like protein/PAS domain S-box-containing protein